MDEPWGTDLEAEMSAGKMAVAFMVCSLCVFALFASDACYMGAQLGMFEHAVGQHWPPPLRLPRSPKSPADSDGRSRPGSLASVGSPSRGDGSLHVDHLPVAIDPAKVSLQLLIDQTALKTGKWPISLTGLNGTCVYRAESNATTPCAQQGKACIEIFTGDDYRMPVAIISEDFEFLDHSHQVYAKLRPVGPSNYILEPVGPSYILQQTPRLSFGLDPSGYLHVTPQSKNGNLKGAPYATVAPVYCLTECLEINCGQGSGSNCCAYYCRSPGYYCVSDRPRNFEAIIQRCGVSHSARIRQKSQGSLRKISSRIQFRLGRICCCSKSQLADTVADTYWYWSHPWPFSKIDDAISIFTKGGAGRAARSSTQFFFLTAGSAARAKLQILCNGQFSSEHQ